MIVYQRNPARVENFHTVSQVLPGLELFPACDGLNDYEAILEDALGRNWIDADLYLHRWEQEEHPGKVAVDCSHLHVLELVRRAPGWCLVLEDDVAWTGGADAWSELRDIAAEADEAGVDFINLLPYPGKSSAVVLSSGNLMSPNLYRGLPMWAMAAYLLAPKRADRILNRLPLTDNFDRWILQVSSGEAGFATHAAELFKPLGSCDYEHKGAALGSIIWSNREDGQY